MVRSVLITGKERKAHKFQAKGKNTCFHRNGQLGRELTLLDMNIFFVREYVVEEGYA